MKFAHIFYFLVLSAIMISCTEDKTENNLMTGERKFLEGLGILDLKEEIELFECNSGNEDVTESGSLITARRIAGYWIEDNKKEVYSAFFDGEIDSISQTDNHTALTYASYLTVYKTDGSSFEVYFDTDSARTYQFFNQARGNWEKYRKNN